MDLLPRVFPVRRKVLAQRFFTKSALRVRSGNLKQFYRKPQEWVQFIAYLLRPFICLTLFGSSVGAFRKQDTYVIGCFMQKVPSVVYDSFESQLIAKHCVLTPDEIPTSVFYLKIALGCSIRDEKKMSFILIKELSPSY